MRHTQPMHFESPAAVRHAYILSSPSREEALHTAHEIASAAVCLAGHDVPCGLCRGCRKASSGIHPDIITVRRETDKSGNLRRELSVGQIRDIAVDAQVLPSEAPRKVYIIEEAELMNLNAQNAALKLLEEPPPTVVFLLCTSNPELLLETVRSRCAIIGLAAEEDVRDDESIRLAESFLTAVRSGDPARLYRWVAKNELSKLDATTAFIDAALQRTADMLCGRISPGALSDEQQMHLYRLLERCSSYLKVNVNAKHIFSLLTVGALMPPPGVPEPDEPSGADLTDHRAQP